MFSFRGDVPNIQDYGVVGDCRSAALISKYGSLEWLCWPRFDSPSLFAAILDRDKGGHWLIAPSQPYEVQRAYVRDSNVLQTTFLATSGQAILTDLMPVSSDDFQMENLLPDHELIREIRCAEGTIGIEIDFYPRADYGLASAHIQKLGGLGLQINVGRGSYWLRSTIPLEIKSDRACASMTLKKGDALQFSLSYAEEAPAVIPALGERIDTTIARSIQWWQQWTSRCSYQGPYREAVIRSALALKMLTYAPSGAIMAAVTTSLPERIGDALNWDYRYCWLRDASLAVRALLGLGYISEAEAFVTWLLHSTKLTQPELRVLYTVFGRIPPAPRELPHLNGYRGSRPVRISNRARRQIQLDVYGEVIHALTQFSEHVARFDRTTQRVLIGLGKYVAKNWMRLDNGIWESQLLLKRTDSRLMCWAALNSLLKLHQEELLEHLPLQLFIEQKDLIRREIEDHCWNESLQSYVSTVDGDQLDAVLLRIPWYGFIPAPAERMRKTYQAIQKNLDAGNGLLYRYQRCPAEGAFGACGFWAVEYLALGGGTMEEAHDLFRRLLSYGNDLGLFSEEIAPDTGDLLGNFPQAFTHMALVNAALSLQEQEEGKQYKPANIGRNRATRHGGRQQ